MTGIASGISGVAGLAFGRLVFAEQMYVYLAGAAIFTSAMFIITTADLDLDAVLLEPSCRGRAAYYMICGELLALAVSRLTTHLTPGMRPLRVLAAAVAAAGIGMGCCCTRGRRWQELPLCVRPTSIFIAWCTPFALSLQVELAWHGLAGYTVVDAWVPVSITIVLNATYLTCITIAWWRHPIGDKYEHRTMIFYWVCWHSYLFVGLSLLAQAFTFDWAKHCESSGCANASMEQAPRPSPSPSSQLSPPQRQATHAASCCQLFFTHKLCTPTGQVAWDRSHLRGVISPVDALPPRGVRRGGAPL